MRPLRWLDFDIENMPLAYLGPDYTTAQVTAIAAGFVGEGKIHCWLLGRDSYTDILDNFVRLYNEADGVTGHYIRGHDLPIINGALIEQGRAPLADKMTCDTKLDLLPTKYLSQSQENLAQMYGLAEEKTHMSNASWREANRMTPAGLRRTKNRVVNDVKQHMALRAILIRRGLLASPKTWRSK